MANELNAREQLEAAMTWLGYQHEDLSYGLKSAEDGLKLWRAWRADPKLPEFCDGWDDVDERFVCVQRVRKILGYDPWKRQATMADAA